jgi:hypothetical protein
LELIGRAYLSSGSNFVAQAITFQVGPAAASTVTIPANNKTALAMLVGLMVSLGYALSRKK